MTSRTALTVTVWLVAVAGRWGKPTRARSSHRV